MPVPVAMLPRDARGFPIPFFAPWRDGKPVFAVADERKRAQCATQRLCWICGQPLFDRIAFVGGPQAAENRSFGDPASHVECAVYAVQVCPFIADPNYRARAFSEGTDAVPGQIDAKPDRTCVYVTHGYKVLRFPNGDWLLRADPATEVQWWKDGVKL